MRFYVPSHARFHAQGGIMNVSKIVMAIVRCEKMFEYHSKRLYLAQRTKMKLYDLLRLEEKKGAKNELH